jgi:hypothetical protein
MESWYGLLWKHERRHRELLRAAERARVANELLKQERARNHAADAPADGAAERVALTPFASGDLRPAEQT